MGLKMWTRGDEVQVWRLIATSGLHSTKQHYPPPSSLIKGLILFISLLITMHRLLDYNYCESRISLKNTIQV